MIKTKVVTEGGIIEQELEAYGKTEELLAELKVLNLGVLKNISLKSEGKELTTAERVELFCLIMKLQGDVEHDESENKRFS
jgi:hypothetical protein